MKRWRQCCKIQEWLNGNGCSENLAKMMLKWCSHSFACSTNTYWNHNRYLRSNSRVKKESKMLTLYILPPKTLYTDRLYMASTPIIRTQEKSRNIWGLWDYKEIRSVGQEGPQSVKGFKQYFWHLRHHHTHALSSLILCYLECSCLFLVLLLFDSSFPYYTVSPKVKSSFLPLFQL